jgi:hypothetical protein
MAMEFFQVSLASLIPIDFSNLTSVSIPVMHSFLSLLVSTFAAQAALALPGPTRTKREIAKRALDDWITTESPYALTEILCNIGSDGCAVSGAASGLVIASPDRVNPDCRHYKFYQPHNYTKNKMVDHGILLASVTFSCLDKILTSPQISIHGLVTPL